MHDPVTIITNTYKRPLELVTRSVRASLAQEPAADRVILIDQNPEPLLFDETITQHPRFEHWKSTSTCVSEARNALLEHDFTGWLIFCDDDGYLDEGYLKKWRYQRQLHPDKKIFAGAIIRDDNGEFYTPRHRLGGNLERFFSTKLLMGSNFSVEAQTFRALRGFDSRFGAGSYWGSGEETDFAWKAYFKKIPMFYTPELRVLHVRPYATDFQEGVHKAFRYGRGKGALVAKWLMEERRLTVLGELGEMFLLPFYQSLKALLQGSMREVVYPLSALVGRAYGLIAFLFRKVGS